MALCFYHCFRWRDSYPECRLEDMDLATAFLHLDYPAYILVLSRGTVLSLCFYNINANNSSSFGKRPQENL